MDVLSVVYKIIILINNTFFFLTKFFIYIYGNIIRSAHDDATAEHKSCSIFIEAFAEAVEALHTGVEEGNHFDEQANGLPFSPHGEVQQIERLIGGLGIGPAGLLDLVEDGDAVGRF